MKIAPLLLLGALAACRRAPEPAATPAPAAASAPAPARAAAPDSLQQSRDRYVAQVMQSIAGRENQPANEVFRNIKVFLVGVPASRLVAIMNIGYSRSLGVSCDHCHVPGEWDRDDKPAKDVARQMVAMNTTINNTLLKNVKGIRSETPVVNCTTCHRGQVKPALNLP